MKKIVFYTSILSTTLFFTNCNAPQNNKSALQNQELELQDMASAESSVNYGENKMVSEPSLTLPTDKKIIRTGSIGFESSNLVESKNYILQLVKQKNAYIESEDANASTDYSSISLTIRIPAKDFDGFLSILENDEDKVVSKNIQANDVTAQYVDVESRLKTKRMYLDRYQKLVASAKTTKDLLEIEEQIRSLQEEIESFESTFRVLNNQISYSTLTVTFSNQQDRITSGPSFYNQLKDAFSDSWKVLTSLFFGLIRIWPIILFVVLMIFLFRKYKKRGLIFRKKNQL